MALSESALSELLDAFRAGDGVDLIRESVRLVLQELIEAEVTGQIGAARYERTDGRTTERNGHRPRLLATQVGDIGELTDVTERERAQERPERWGANGLNPNTLDVDPGRSRPMASMFVAAAIMPITGVITLTAEFGALV